jgi:hypothetical protein
MKIQLITKAILVVLSVLLLGSIACGKKTDPRDAEIQYLRGVEQQHIQMLTDRVNQLETQKAAIEQRQLKVANPISTASTVAGEYLIAHLEREAVEDRAALLEIAVNPPQLQVAGALIDLNRSSQNTIVELAGQQTRLNESFIINKQGQLLDGWVSGSANQFSGRPRHGDCDNGFGSFSPFGMDADWSRVSDPNHLPWQWVDGELMIGDF